MKIFLTTLFSLLLAGTAFAQGINKEDQWALQQVQKMLNNPGERNQEIAKSPGAQAAHQNAVNTVGAGNIDEVYAITAIVMEDLVRMSGGDVQKMQSILQNGKTNPAGFYQLLSPAAINAIKRLAPKAGGKSS
jgi:hypothetical protein